MACPPAKNLATRRSRRLSELNHAGTSMRLAASSAGVQVLSGTISRLSLVSPLRGQAVKSRPQLLVVRSVLYDSSGHVYSEYAFALR